MVSSETQIELIKLLIFVLPAWIANAVPVVLGGGTPVDLNKKMRDGTRILGDGKTIRGFVSGIIFGAITGVIIANIIPAEYSIYSTKEAYYLSGILMGFGAMLGDSLGSFIKRRMSVGQGKPLVLLDQLTFLYTAIILSVIVAPISLDYFDIIILTITTYAIHAFTNFFSHQIGLKKVPW